MKKFFVLLSATYLLTLLFTGCTTNFFKSLDKTESEATLVSNQIAAEDALNSGNYALAIQKIDEILAKNFQGITSSNQLKDDPEKRKIYIDIMSKKGEALLGKSGVEALSIIKTLSDLSVNSSTATQTAILITDILENIDTNSLSKARDAFSASLPDSGSLTPDDDKEALKPSYQSAAIAYALTAASTLNTIKETLETGTESQANQIWNQEKSTIVNDLFKASESISIAYSTDTSSSIDIESLDIIKQKVNDTTYITKSNFDSILTGN